MFLFFEVTNNLNISLSYKTREIRETNQIIKKKKPFLYKKIASKGYSYQTLETQMGNRIYSQSRRNKKENMKIQFYFLSLFTFLGSLNFVNIFT